ncbi:ATP-binding component of an ABC superfamily cystine transporter [Ewingella americana ATCC 33852]|uniref:ATP-binding component of an ABC superfamily cystine transporter n=1 Tax=Ewingella americana (strain ATCC 33852 / DSM 4580 / CCUG 14506 / JCM 5911 / LMG 7869 / NCTC 12157 / CDC 1468-78) TaxID=910964 RepID=A0A085GFJ2_EWIA3|nr:ATP-binding component of an ABC superfamily cystine transporter [Ewingella americana ATCC 33852]
MSTIDVKQLTKKFNGQTVLHGIDLQVNAGEVVAIIGPSGSGKTTLLRSINLLEEPNSGTIKVGNIEIDGSRSISKQKENVRKLRQQVGFVFQNFNLFPHRSVLDNIIEGPVIVKGESREKAVAYARQLLEKVGLSGKEDAYPRRLSGGQQQRVAIARALAMNPEVILFDEPTSALDPELVGEVLNTHPRLGARAPHHGDRHPRNELRPRRRRPRDFHGPREDRRARPRQRAVLESAACEDKTVSREVFNSLVKGGRLPTPF